MLVPPFAVELLLLPLEHPAATVPTRANIVTAASFLFFIGCLLRIRLISTSCLVDLSPATILCDRIYGSVTVVTITVTRLWIVVNLDPSPDVCIFDSSTVWKNKRRDSGGSQGGSREH